MNAHMAQNWLFHRGGWGIPPPDTSNLHIYRKELFRIAIS